MNGFANWKLPNRNNFCVTSKTSREVKHMKRKKQDAPFELRDPIVPDVRGAANSASDIVTPNGSTNASDAM